MADTYQSYSHLCDHEQEDVDFRVVVVERGSPAVLAPHGGGIEPGTSEIAREVAGDDLSLYLFEGLKLDGNAVLHITSHRFEEPRCIALVERAESAVAIHGCQDRPGSASVVFVGGGDEELRGQLIDQLTRAGFPAEVDTTLSGTHGENVCNRAKRQGAQLEITEGARLKMFRSLKRDGRNQKHGPFFLFCEALRSVVSS